MSFPLSLSLNLPFRHDSSFYQTVLSSKPYYSSPVSVLPPWSWPPTSLAGTETASLPSVPLSHCPRNAFFICSWDNLFKNKSNYTALLLKNLQWLLLQLEYNLNSSLWTSKPHMIWSGPCVLPWLPLLPLPLTPSTPLGPRSVPHIRFACSCRRAPVRALHLRFLLCGCLLLIADAHMPLSQGGHSGHSSYISLTPNIVLL